MEVMTCVTEPNSPSMTQRFSALGSSVGTDALQQPKIWDVREPDLSIEGEDATGDAIQQGIEAVGENPRSIGLTHTFGVLKDPHDFRLAF